jgi:uncharacterized protein with PQ loop repeat
MDQLIGLITIVTSLLVKLLGEPDPIRRNFRRKSTAGLSPLLYVLSLIAYVSWTIHGVLQDDRVIIVAQSVGILTS